MKRIGVLSDTHLHTLNSTLPIQVHQIFTKVDIILHAGDLTNLRVLGMLNAPEIIAVCGNMDDPEVKQTLPNKRVLEIEGFRIGLTHGWGSPFGIINRVKSLFVDVNCIIFGHSHQPTNIIIDNVLFFNPGSVSRGIMGNSTVGLLYIEKDIKGKIIKL